MQEFVHRQVVELAAEATKNGIFLDQFGSSAFLGRQYKDPFMQPPVNIYGKFEALFNKEISNFQNLRRNKRFQPEARLVSW